MPLQSKRLHVEIMVEAVIYYIIFRGQSPFLEALHMEEKDHGLVCLHPAGQSEQTDKCSREHLCLLTMANSHLLEFYCLGFSQGT